MNAPSPRRGAALIATLLLLGGLLGLSLLYVSLVRLERLVTQVEEGRDDLNLELESLLARTIPFLAETYPSNQVYALPDQTDLWRSTGTGSAVGLVSTNDAEQAWLPEGLRGQQNHDAGWDIVGDTNQIHLATAWLAFDVSGLLDPNVVGRLPRAAASTNDPASIQTDWLGYAPDPSEPWRLTPREFAVAHPDAAPIFLPGPFSADRGWYLWGSGWQSNTVIGAETLSLDPTQWTESQVQAVMTERYPSNNLQELTDAFLDFWDTDAVPRRTDTLCAEPVPMFNEASALLVVSNNGPDVTIDILVQIEIWFPSVGNVETNLFRVSESPAFVGRNTESQALSYQDQTSTNEWVFSVDQDFRMLGLRYLYQGPFPSNGVVMLDVELGNLRLDRVDGAAIDAFPTNLAISLPEIPLPPTGGVDQVRWGLEVTDPRLNHRFGEWVATSNATPLAINQAAIDAQAADDRTDPFVTWAPVGLTNGLEAAWIGFMPLDEPWRSVDLFGEDGRWWLAHTRDPGAVLGRWERGRVNPNGAYTSAVAAVFVDVPMETWPGEPGAALVEVDLALAMAADIQTALSLGSGSTNRADWTWAVEDLLLSTLGEDGRHQAESIVRHSYRMFEPAGQVWGIWLMAERRSAAPASTWPRRRALALVWWDPFPDAEGRHAWSLIRCLDLPESGN